MTTWQRARTIVENESVAAKRDEAEKEYLRFNELWMSVSWLIARKGAELGVHRIIKGVEYRLYVVAAPSEDFPELTLLYTVDKDSVIIHEIGIQIGQEAAQSAAVAKIH